MWQIQISLMCMHNLPEAMRSICVVGRNVLENANNFNLMSCDIKEATFFDLIIS